MLSVYLRHMRRAQGWLVGMGCVSSGVDGLEGCWVLDETRERVVWRDGEAGFF
jgi:hypothetical protein